MPPDDEGPKDPEFHSRETLPELEANPVNDTEPPPPSRPTSFTHFGAVETPEPPPLIIPKGHAQNVFAAALEDLGRAMDLVEAVGMALARQLDAQAED